MNYIDIKNNKKYTQIHEILRFLSNNEKKIRRKKRIYEHYELKKIICIDFFFFFGSILIFLSHEHFELNIKLSLQWIQLVLH